MKGNSFEDKQGEVFDNLSLVVVKEEAQVINYHHNPELEEILQISLVDVNVVEGV